MFKDALPYYLAIGMTYELYWSAEPYLVVSFRKAHEIKVEETNQQLWLQGVYNFSAVSTALSNLHFDGKKHKPNNYMDKPINLKVATEEEKRKKVKEERQKVVNTLNLIKMNWDMAHINKKQ